MHFLRKDECSYPQPLRRPYAARKVWLERKGKAEVLRLVVLPEDEKDHGVVICQMDVMFVPLPERVKVIGPDGKAIKPRCKHFWVSVETFDPYHLVTDAPSMPLPSR